MKKDNSIWDERSDMDDKTLKAYQAIGIEVKTCEKCGKRPATRRHWNRKVLCNHCAYNSLKAYLATLCFVGVIVGAVVFTR